MLILHRQVKSEGAMATKNSEKTEKKLANLKPFKPGESGNPNGRPEGTKNRSTILKKWLEVATKVKDLNGIEVEGTVEDKMAIAIIKKGIEGDVPAFKEIADSVYGKAPQTIHNTGEMKIQIVYKEQFGNDPLPE